MGGLNSLGWKIHDHLKEQRPKMFQGSKSCGQLNKYLLDRQTEISDRLTFLGQQGLQPHEAREMLRDEIYLPSEEGCAASEGKSEAVFGLSRRSMNCFIKAPV